MPVLSYPTINQVNLDLHITHHYDRQKLVNNRRVWFRLLLSIALSVALLGHFSTATAQTPTLELRGVWLTNIDSNVLFSRRSVRRAIQRLGSLNFNTVYPTVWNWGYTLYPSSTAARVIGRSIDPAPGLARRDVLAEIVTQGHQRGLSVIPWFEFGLMAPADSDLVRRHPDWVTQRRDGSQIVMEGIHPRVWLNPVHPDVQRFILDLVTEIVGYDIDGIQFDDHFGMPADLGYDAYTLQVYQRENLGKLPPSNPQDPAWMRWRSNKITALMTQVFATVKQRKPHCILALAPNPQDFSYQAFLQDWARWERAGYIEELILQIYRDDLTSFTSELSRPEVLAAKSHIPVGVGILTGLKDRLVPMSQIQGQVQAVRDRAFAGVSFFFYETLGDRDSDFRRLFPTRADRPRIGG